MTDTSPGPDLHAARPCRQCTADVAASCLVPGAGRACACALAVAPGPACNTGMRMRNVSSANLECSSCSAQFGGDYQQGAGSRAPRGPSPMSSPLPNPQSVLLLHCINIATRPDKLGLA